jgi:tRNA(fMet)-specific endonuclease VapC
MLRFLLDTNIISEPFKLTPSPSVIAKLRTNNEESAIASITWHELLFGFHRLPASRRSNRSFSPPY